MMMAWRANVTKQESGAILVEATLTMLPFLLIIFAIAEGGRLLQVQNTLTNAAREGARFGVAPYSQTSSEAGNMPSFNEIQTVVNGFLNSAGIPSSQVRWDPPSSDPSLTTVGFTYSYMPLTVGLFPFLQVDLSGRATMKNETSW